MKINEMFSLRRKNGEVGIEIEIEGRKLPEGVKEWWRVTGDGSLRGNGFEYVLSNPIKREAVPEALAYLMEQFEKTESTLKPSDRCGVHVHVNCQTLTFNQVMSFITLYLSLEDILVHYCGEEREGNLFCLRARDAEAIIPSLVECVQHQHFQPAMMDNIRYASMNITALAKYGSLEFRSLPTPKDMQEITTWVNLLLRVKDAAMDFSNAAAVIEGISMAGADRFLAQVFGPLAEIIETRGQDRLLMEGIRRVQDLAYVRPIPKLVKRYQNIDVDIEDGDLQAEPEEAPEADREVIPGGGGRFGQGLQPPNFQPAHRGTARPQVVPRVVWEQLSLAERAALARGQNIVVAPAEPQPRAAGRRRPRVRNRVQDGPARPRNRRD